MLQQKVCVPERRVFVFLEHTSSGIEIPGTWDFLKFFLRFFHTWVWFMPGLSFSVSGLSCLRHISEIRTEVTKRDKNIFLSFCMLFLANCVWVSQMLYEQEKHFFVIILSFTHL